MHERRDATPGSASMTHRCWTPYLSALILHLATAADVFVVVTVAAGDQVPDAIDSLWKDGGARRIELQPISDAAIEKLVETVLEGPVEQSALQRVVDASQGSLLYARELVVGALQEGRLVFDAGLWRLRRRAVSPALSALVNGRMGALEDAERYPLELLALGEPLRLGELAQLTELGLLETLESRAMVSVAPGSPDSVIRLSQPLYGEVLRAGLPVLRARNLRLQLAETVARRSPLTPDDALRIARWRLDAGTTVAPEYLLAAGRAANVAGDAELGAQLGGLALDAGLGLEAVLVIGRAHIIRNRFEAAEGLLAAAEAEARGNSQAAGYVAQRMHVLYWGLHRVAVAHDFLERAASWSDAPEWHRRLDPWRLLISGFVDGVDGDSDSPAPESSAAGHTNLDARANRQMELAHVFRLMASGRIKDAEALVRRIQPQVPMIGNDDAYGLGLALLLGLEGGEDWSALATLPRSSSGTAFGPRIIRLLALARSRSEQCRWLAGAIATHVVGWPKPTDISRCRMPSAPCSACGRSTLASHSSPAT